VNYHGVLPDGYVVRDLFLDGNLVSKQTLRKQIRLLKDQYHVISPGEFRKWLEGAAELTSRAVLITCDDGLLNTLTDMLPVLKSEGVPCLFFILGASTRTHGSRLWYEELYQLLTHETHDSVMNARRVAVFRAHWWQAVLEMSGLDPAQREDRIGRLRNRHRQKIVDSFPTRWRLLNSDQLRQLADAGMEIGAHTLSHPVLSACDEGLARREIKESKLELERILGKPVWAFAYPFGNPETMGDREVKLAREFGFTCAFVNTGGGMVDRSQPFTLARTHVTAQMSLAEFEAHLSGFHQRLQRAARG
jgi:peptidoglycan/xylan/chitin deacetylase (PgdA/CDA1 family)